jgi:hypothetical protein
VFGFPYIARRLPESRWTPTLLQNTYEDGREILRDVLVTCTQHDFAVSRLQVQKEPLSSPGSAAAGTVTPVDGHADGREPAPEAPRLAGPRTVSVVLEVQGTGPVSKLAAKLANIAGVISVNAGDVNVLAD